MSASPSGRIGVQVHDPAGATPDLTMTHDIHDATRGRNGRRCWVHVRSRFTSISVDRPVKQESYNGLVHIFCNTVYTG